MDQYSDPNIGPDSGQMVAANTATEAKERAELQERLERQELQARLNRQNSAQNPNFDPGAADPNVAATQNDRNSTIIGQGLTALDIPRKYTTGPLLARALGVSDKMPPTWSNLLTNYPDTDAMGKIKEFAKRVSTPYPGTGEMLHEGGYLPNQPIMRGILGAVGDMAQPAMVAGRLAEVPKIGGVLEGLASPEQKILRMLAKPAGITTARRAFKNLDAEAIRQGKKTMPSQVLVDPEGTGEFTAAWKSSDVNNKIGDVAEKLNDNVLNVLKDAKDRGATIDPETALKYVQGYRDVGGNHVPGMLDHYYEMAYKPDGSIRDSSAKDVYDALKEKLEGIDWSGTDPMLATKLKTMYAKQLPTGKWAKYADTSLPEELDKALSRGLRESVENSAEDTLGKGAGEVVRSNNDKLGALLSTRKKEVGQVAKEKLRDYFTAVDALGAGAAISSGVNPAGLLSLKKAHDLMKRQGPASMLGLGMYKLGASRNASMLMTPIERSAWSVFDNNEEEKKRDKE